VIDNQTKAFIASHIDTDIYQLAIHADKYRHVDFDYALKQITARQKRKEKLPTLVKNPDIIFPHGIPLEQCSSETTALYKSSLISGERLIDLTAGFGVDAFFMANNFNETICIEKNRALFEILQQNIQVLDRNNMIAICDDAAHFLSSLQSTQQKTTFYLDPARRGKKGEKIVDLLLCEPDILKLKELLYAHAEKILLKLSPMMDIKQAVRYFPETEEVHIIAVDNECKELALLISPHKKTKEVDYIAVNIKKEKSEIFKFKEATEANAIPQIADQIEKYIYEPNSAIMKAGGFKTVGNVYKLKKLDYQTHLYTSEQLIEQFPGRIFKVYLVSGFSKSELKPLIGNAYHISVRNFPQTVDELKKQLKIKEGGSLSLIATTTKEKKVLLLCERTLLFSRSLKANIKKQQKLRKR